MFRPVKAWVVDHPGHYRQSLQLRDVDPPKCPRDGAVLGMTAAALNFPDLLIIAGKYQVRPPTPFIPGLEAVGIILESGPDSQYNVGERVLCHHQYGSFAERCTESDPRLFPIPPQMTDAHAAGLMVAYQTSYFGLIHRARLQPGETLLVHGGAGGVGSSAIQLGKIIGAKVIATAGTNEKLSICRKAGADHVINYKQDDFVEAVKSVTAGHGANVIYDPVGGDVFDKSTKCIAWDGRLVVVGFASGRIPEIAANRILLKNIAIVGLHWSSYVKTQPTLIREAHEQLCTWYTEKKFEPQIYREFEFDDLPQAFEAMESRQSHGKIILKSPTSPA